MSHAERPPTIALEEDRIPGRTIAWIAVAGVVITLASIGVAGWLGHRDARALGPASQGPATVPPRVGLIDQTAIGDDAYGELLRAQQQRELQQFSWIDRDAGTARIPIDRAIDLFVQQESSR